MRRASHSEHDKTAATRLLRPTPLKRPIHVPIQTRTHSHRSRVSHMQAAAPRKVRPGSKSVPRCHLDPQSIARQPAAEQLIGRLNGELIAQHRC